GSLDMGYALAGSLDMGYALAGSLDMGYARKVRFCRTRLTRQTRRGFSSQYFVFQSELETEFFIQNLQ
ncbi:MAG: hypothetical protein JJU29_21685, partial [Verrucomicrobia bacterium]|nr:hypothetical protein [Verrucomicrobiota bacterium]